MTTIAVSLAHRLASAAASRAGASWFWLESGGTVDSKRAYLGLSHQVLTAGSEGEQELVNLLQTNNALAAACEPQREGTQRQPRFTGGWVVAFAYEFAAVSVADDRDLSTTVLAMRVPAVIEVDHVSNTARLHHEPDAPESLISSLQQCIDTATLSEANAVAHCSAIAPLSWRITDSDYAGRIVAAQQSMRHSDLSVLCLTNRAEASFDERPDPLTLFLQLRARSNAPRAGIIVHGEEALISASPERFIEIADGWVETAPMKGTRQRGATCAEDEAQAAELAANPKELAENRAVTELVRAELARVCEFDTVEVTHDCEVLTFELVHQLVSTVRGRIAKDHDVWSVLAELFPGASMTGAPKPLALRVLETLEPERRGWYSGCFGWISRDGRAAQLAMTIRSIVLEGSSASIGAGGGITVLSHPDHEVAEMHLKAAALIETLGE